jgi:hypothetical protein
VPDVITLPLLMFNASMGGNYQIASITALLLLIPSIGFMLLVERFLKADVLAMVGRWPGHLGIAVEWRVRSAQPALPMFPTFPSTYLARIALIPVFVASITCPTWLGPSRRTGRR